jgi:hypothetical protein
MATVFDLFKVMLIVSLFFSFGITLLSYALPDDTLQYVTAFRQGSGSIEIATVGSQVESSLRSQTNIPLIELGALVFYSGNILIDFLVNFVFAIPEMVGMLINGVTMLFGVDSMIFAQVEIFFSVLMVVLYFIGLIQLLTNVRSGRLV